MLADSGIDISPNESGLPGITQLRDIVGAVMTVGLVLAVLAAHPLRRVQHNGSQPSGRTTA